MMSNETLKGMVDKYGDRICSIIMNNESRLLIGYHSEGLKSAKDILYDNMGDCDLFGVPYMSPPGSSPRIKAVKWHPTEVVEQVVVMDEDYEDYRIDPMQI